VLYDAASITPAAVPLVSLQQLGPRQLPRLWSAMHDALLYADPRLAVGGKVGRGSLLSKVCDMMAGD
jgi:hypothetical protein